MNNLLKSLLMVIVGFVPGMLTGLVFVDSRGYRLAHESYEERWDDGKDLYRFLSTHFGTINLEDPDYKNIIDSHTIYKDMDIAILEKDGLKSLKVYE